VFLHVDARVTPWLLQVRIENMQRSASPVIFERAFGLATAGEDVVGLLNDLLTRLTILLALKREPPNEELVTPPLELLPGYLAGIEQALAIGLAARQLGGASFLYQERSIFDHLFDVTLHGPRLLRPRMLLVNALENQTRRRKDIVVEYLEKLALLEQRHAMPPGQGSELVAQGIQAVIAKARG
jgi:hypothetical protein